MTQRHTKGSALILALSVIMILVVLGGVGIIFARHERVESNAFLNTNNTTHAVNAGIEEGITLAHTFSDPRRQLCELNNENPTIPTCDANTTQEVHVNGTTIQVNINFTNYTYPSNATFTVCAPRPNCTLETTVTLAPNLEIQSSTTRIPTP